MRLYHVVAIHKHGVTYMTRHPVTHAEGCTLMVKLTIHPCRTIQLQEVS